MDARSDRGESTHHPHPQTKRIVLMWCFRSVGAEVGESAGECVLGGAFEGGTRPTRSVSECWSTAVIHIQRADLSNSKVDSFIRSKYEGRRWAMDGPVPDDPRILDNATEEDVRVPLLLPSRNNDSNGLCVIAPSARGSYWTTSTNFIHPTTETCFSRTRSEPKLKSDGETSPLDNCRKCKCKQSGATTTTATTASGTGASTSSASRTKTSG